MPFRFWKTSEIQLPLYPVNKNVDTAANNYCPGKDAAMGITLLLLCRGNN